MRDPANAFRSDMVATAVVFVLEEGGGETWWREKGSALAFKEEAAATAEGKEDRSRSYGLEEESGDGIEVGEAKNEPRRFNFPFAMGFDLAVVAAALFFIVALALSLSLALFSRRSEIASQAHIYL